MRSYGLGQPYIHLYTRLWYIHLKGSGQLNVHGSGQPNVHGSWRWPSTQRYTTYSLWPSTPPIAFGHQYHLQPLAINTTYSLWPSIPPIACGHQHHLQPLAINTTYSLWPSTPPIAFGHQYHLQPLAINTTYSLWPSIPPIAFGHQHHLQPLAINTKVHHLQPFERVNLTLIPASFLPPTSSHCHTTLIAHVPHIKPCHRNIRASRNADLISLPHNTHSSRPSHQPCHRTVQTSRNADLMSFHSHTKPISNVPHIKPCHRTVPTSRNADLISLPHNTHSSRSPHQTPPQDCSNEQECKQARPPYPLRRAAPP